MKLLKPVKTKHLQGTKQNIAFFTAIIAAYVFQVTFFFQLVSSHLTLQITNMFSFKVAKRELIYLIDNANFRNIQFSREIILLTEHIQKQWYSCELKIVYLISHCVVAWIWVFNYTPITTDCHLPNIYLLHIKTSLILVLVVCCIDSAQMSAVCQVEPNAQMLKWAELTKHCWPLLHWEGLRTVCRSLQIVTTNSEILQTKLCFWLCKKFWLETTHAK